jgi:predicted ferric reductase
MESNKPNYQLRKVVGWVALILISLLPVFLLMAFGPKKAYDLADYGMLTHSLGQVFGLVGMTMFALTFVLSTRIKAIEDVFGGLDKVYIVHAVLGSIALVLILAHPIFLVLKFIPQEIDIAAAYLLPSGSWSVNFGIIALLTMIVLISITLFTKLRYDRWKFTHEFLGLVFFLAVLHIFLVRSTVALDNIFDGYYFYATAVSIMGLGAFSYSLFIKNRVIMNAVFRIKKISKTKEYFILEMTPEHKSLAYDSGQFVFLRFYNQGLSREAHPFSIASKSNSEVLRIVIKKLGDYTNKLDVLKEGDRVSVEGPYGRFNFRNYEDRNQVWIAAGIGITPFLGMVEDIDRRNNITLFYTVKDDSDFVGYNVFAEAAKKNKNFNFFPWSSSKNGHLTVKEFMKNANIKDCEFLICGPERFKEDLIKQLQEAGVKRSRIHEEAFGFR